MDSDFERLLSTLPQLKSSESRAVSEVVSCLGWPDPMTEEIYICHFAKKIEGTWGTNTITVNKGNCTTNSVLFFSLSFP